LIFRLQDETSRCVKCGLCLPECPTYQLTHNEACSPRGRIALADALDKKQIAPGRQFRQRMNHCLLCRRCEKTCPSGVKFASIMDETRTQQNSPGSIWQTLLHNIVSQPIKLRKILNSIQWLRPLIPVIPQLQQTIELADYYPATGVKKGALALFKGCTTDTLEPHTLEAAITLLNHAGQDVHIPPNQGCCGALHAHAGDKQQAAALRAANAEVFSDQPFDILLSIASGCGAYLADDQHLPVSHMDICTFLAQPAVIRHLQFRPLKAVAALHIPCSQENVLGSDQAVLDLLTRVPGLELHTLSKGQCCGAAGSYYIFHPKTAGRLRQPFLRQIRQISPDYLISGNIGCALHLSNGLRERGKKPPQIMHPVTLLAQQLVEKSG